MQQTTQQPGAVQYRIARPTNKMAEVARFYKEAVGLTEIGSFTNHAGYDGVMLGLPSAAYHLEFTQQINGSPCPAPTKDNLLVLYFNDPTLFEQAVQRMKTYGQSPVPPENPYWEGKSFTFEDPDGWRVVLYNGIFQAAKY